MNYKDDPDFKDWLKLSAKQKQERIRKYSIGGNLRAEAGGFAAGLVGDFDPEPATVKN